MTEPAKKCACCGADLMPHDHTAIYNAVVDIGGTRCTLCRSCMHTIVWVSGKKAAPENKPLTLEQLRQMDGEPVWVVFAGNVDWPPKAHWCFVRATKCILQVYPCAVHQAKNWLYTEQDFNRGVANAYARKPEGSA